MPNTGGETVHTVSLNPPNSLVIHFLQNLLYKVVGKKNVSEVSIVSPHSGIE